MAVITVCQQPCKWESSTAQAHRQGCSLSIAQEKGKGVQPDSMTSSSEDRHHHNLFEIQRRCNFTKTVSNAFLRHKRIKKLKRISTSTKLAQFCSDEVRLYKKNHSPQCKLRIIIVKTGNKTIRTFIGTLSENWQAKVECFGIQAAEVVLMHSGLLVSPVEM
jgi:hypothetical protein